MSLRLHRSQQGRLLLREEERELELHTSVGTTRRFVGVPEELQLGVNVLLTQL